MFSVLLGYPFTSPLARESWLLLGLLLSVLMECLGGWLLLLQALSVCINSTKKTQGTH